jgi:carboxymethylenebutenolidase
VSVRRTFLLCALCVIVAGCRQAPGPGSGGPIETEVTLPGPEGAGQGLLLVPPTKGPFSAIIVLHGDFGLNQPIRAHARRLAGHEYVVLAIDLYRGQKVDTTLDAHIIDRGLPEERVKADLDSAIALLSTRAEVNPSAIGIIGWDMGGGYALDRAISDPRITACVNCYGRLTTDAALLRKMKGAFLGIYAGKDEGNPPQTRAAFLEAMKEAGKTTPTLIVFADCDQGFMTPSPSTKPRPADEKASNEAWQAIDRFFAETLR